MPTGTLSNRVLDVVGAQAHAAAAHPQTDAEGVGAVDGVEVADVEGVQYHVGCVPGPAGQTAAGLALGRIFGDDFGRRPGQATLALNGGDPVLRGVWDPSWPMPMGSTCTTFWPLG